MTKLTIWRTVIMIGLIAFALSRPQFRELLKLIYG